MKTKLAQMIGFLMLGSAAMFVNAATAPTTPPAPPPLVLSTPLVHGGALQASGRCSVFNAGKASLLLVDVHAEDGQGNVLASTDVKNCANKSLAGLRACTMTFAINATNDSAVCVAKVAAPKPPAKPAATGTTTTAPATPPAPPAPPAPVLGAELLDNAGNVLVYVNGVMVTPPPPPPAQGGNQQPPAQGGTGTTPPPPPAGVQP